MPRTTSVVLRRPTGVVSASSLPTFSSSSSAYDSVTMAPSSPSCASVSARPLGPVELVEVADGRRVDAADDGLLAVDERRRRSGRSRRRRRRRSRRACRRPWRRTSRRWRRRARSRRSGAASSTASLTEARRPLPSTATAVTSVRPTISAAAVAAVRDGLRTEFELARRPAEPPVRRAGQPTRLASGLTSRGAISATPTNSVSTPPPSSSATAPPERPLANTPGRHRRHGGADDAERHLRRVLLHARLRQLRAFAHGRDRRHARRPPGGHDAREQR